MRLKFDARANAILKRLPAVNLYSVIELVLLGALAVQGARLVWTIVTPISPLGDWRPAAPVSSNGAILREFDPFFRLSGASAGPATVTSLQLTLYGTRIDEAMGRGSAILAGPDGVQRSVAVGEEIIPGVKLQSVAFDHVTIDRGGAAEDLFLDQSGGGAPVPQDNGGLAAPDTPPEAVGLTVSNLRDEVGFVPRLDGGRISGLAVRPQGSGAAFRAAGLREGDIITAIGGRPVSGPADLERLTEQFREGGALSLTVERGGQVLPIAVSLVPQS